MTDEKPPRIRVRTPVAGVPVSDEVREREHARWVCTHHEERLEALEECVARIDRQLVVTTGAKGDNGQVGELRRGMSRIHSMLLGVLLAVVGSAVGVYAAVDRAGQRTGAVEVRLQHLERDVEELRTLRWPPYGPQQPASPAGVTRP